MSDEFGPLSEGLELLNIRKERSMRLARQFTEFLDAFMQHWPNHDYILRTSGRDPQGRRKWSRESAEWTKFLNLIKPGELPDKGVGKTFFVIWNSSLSSTSGKERIPADVWLAQGTEITGSKGYELLFVDYVLVGQLRPHEGLVLINRMGEIQKGSIYFSSPVILKPQE